MLKSYCFHARYTFSVGENFRNVGQISKICFSFLSTRRKKPIVKVFNDYFART